MARLSLRTPRALGVVGAAIGVVAVLAVGFTLFASYEPDDTHITFWEAYTLVRDGRIQDYNGARIEPASSLAHAVLSAAAHLATGVAIPTVGVLVPAAFAALAVVLSAVLTARVAPRFALVGPVLVGTSPWLLAWAFGGLDAPIAAAALAGLVLAGARCAAGPASARAWLAAGAALVLVVTTRPEGGPVAIATLAGGGALAALAAWRRGERAAAAAAPYAKLAGLAAVAGAALAGYRRVAFGMWMPNPVYAKADVIRPTDGVVYVARHTGWCAAWILVGLAVALALRARWALADRPGAPATSGEDAPQGPLADASLGLALAACVTVLGFVVAVGGDWMPRGRFLVPLAPLAVPAGLAAAQRLLPRVRPGASALHRAAPVAALAAVVLALSAGATFELEATKHHGEVQLTTAADVRRAERRLAEAFPRHTYGFFEVASEKHLRDIYLREGFQDVLDAIAPMGRPALVATRQAGFVPYYAAADNVRALHLFDVLNLGTADVRRCAPDALHRIGDDPLNGWSYALGVSYDELLDRVELFGPCGLTPPDVIVDAGAPVAGLEERGFTLVYRQRNGRRTEGWVALRQELADAYDVTPRRVVR